MTDVYIVDGYRTAIGKFGGALKEYSAAELGGIVIKYLLNKVNIDPINLDIVLMGQVLRALTGQDTARQASVYAGLPLEVNAITIDMVCSSGMGSVILASSMIKAGDVRNGLIIAGGMESMSQAPFAFSHKYRWGVKFILREKYEIIDTMYHDGLYDIIEHKVMGLEADMVAKEMEVTREELDKIGYTSQRRACDATNKGYFKQEIVPVLRNGNIILDRDEGLRPDTTLEKISRLPPAFSDDGLHTAATSSQLSDGAAVLLLASEEAISKYDLNPRAKIIDYVWSAGPTWKFVTSPAQSVKKLLEKSGYSLSEIDYFENNEAFAISNIVMNRLVGIPLDKLNIFGGAIALGHPIGCSGSRIIVTLLNVMEKMNYRRGIASICHGLGGSTAILIERVK